MTEDQIKEKALFAVTLVAAFLAFSAFKEEMSKIMLPVGAYSYSLLGIAVAFTILLSLSVYLYALGYIRYSFGKYQNFFLLRWIIPTANFFYFIAIVYPLIIFVGLFLTITPIYQLAQHYNAAIVWFDVITGLVTIIGGVVNVFYSTKKMRREQTQLIEDAKNLYLRKSEKLYKQEFYGESILEAFKTLESYLREQLLERNGLTSEMLSFSDLLNLAQANNVVPETLIPAIKELQVMRNSAAHYSLTFTKDQADFAMGLVKEILESAPSKPNDKYFSRDREGEVTFNYSNNDGVYTIGEGKERFDTQWSKASQESIHFYKDQPSIKSVRLCKEPLSFDEINPLEYDASSRVRSVSLKQIAIFENIHGEFLAIKVLGLKDDSRGDDVDEIHFSYKILPK